MYRDLKSFYRSKEWESLKQCLMFERANENGDVICAECGKPIFKAYDCIGHHIVELTESNVHDANVALNPSNIELIHFKCHNKMHSRFGFAPKKEVFLVYGSPCSGKSTWVMNNAGKDDIIIDIDKIWECLTINDKYYKSPKLKSNVFGVRDCLIEQIKMRVGKWNNAFIIGGYPLKIDRERMADMLGAKLVYIDTPKEVCLERAVTDDWKTYIEDWWRDYDI